MSEPDECAEDDHDWRWISDWAGDPDVINGTYDCSRWECAICGKIDEDRDPPSTDLDEDDWRELYPR